MRALLWDNDGVLVDTESLYLRASQELLREVGVELTRDQFVELSLRQGRSCFELAAQIGVGAHHIEELRLRRNARYAELLRDGVEVRRGVQACLQSIHGRLPMAIVTSSNPDHFELIHRNTGLLAYFEFALTGDQCEQHKPHPAPYLKAATWLDVPPEDCLVIEDSERGVASARRAGMRCIAFPHELTRADRFADADRIAASSGELTRAIQELLNT